MDEQAKLVLSPRELEVAMSAEFILTKQHIVHTVNNLFNAQVEVIKNILQERVVSWPMEIQNSAPRIFKGENYKGLPYVILDYPAVFGKENIFALRTMFWWANFFSVTLHLKGSYQKMFAEKICNKLQENIEGIFICVNSDQWEHHFEKSNYILLKDLPGTMWQAQVTSGSFLKLAFKIPLDKWSDASAYLAAFYKEMANLLSD